MVVHLVSRGGAGIKMQIFRIAGRTGRPQILNTFVCVCVCRDSARATVPRGLVNDLGLHCNFDP